MPGSDELVILVPEDLRFEYSIPSKVRTSLDVEMAHNLYDGLFNPKVTEGYEKSLAQEIDAGLRAGEAESNEVTVTVRLGRTWVDASNGEAQPGEQIDAYQVEAAWGAIEQNTNFPGRARYTSVIQSIKADDEGTLRVKFRTSVDLSRRAKEALSFRVFPVPQVQQSVPRGSGAFFLKFPPTKNQFRYLLPSSNFPSPTGADRPRVLVRTVLSSKDRLRQVVKGTAHVALGIPPYYLNDIAGASYRETDPYNVWALVFNQNTLRTPQRLMLAARIDADKLLTALLPSGGNSPWSSETEKLLSPTIFPRNFEVFECLENRILAGRLFDPTLIDTAERLLGDPKEFSRFDGQVAGLPSQLRVAYLYAGTFRDGVKLMAEKLKTNIEGQWPNVDVDLDGQQEAEWRQTVSRLNQDSQFDIAIVRFEYQRRCDVSVHFQQSATPSVREGIFSWVVGTPESKVLSWDSNNLKKFREVGYCDAAVEPALRVVKAVHDLAPAKFLFSVPNLAVFQPTVDLEVNDEYVLAGLKDWHVTQ